MTAVRATVPYCGRDALRTMAKNKDDWPRRFNQHNALSIPERFWSKVDRDGPVPAHMPSVGKCWVWMASDRRGYGVFSPTRKESVSAHRFSWVLRNGAIPAGLFVLHHCDNTRCVRPSHLWLGTNEQNRADSVRKGRVASGKRCGVYTHPESRARGERHGCAKINARTVRKIRAWIRRGETQRAIAVRVGLEQSTVGRIARRQNWAHV